jgi:hypothetical protein
MSGAEHRPWGPLAVVAVLSSLVTVGALELLGAPRAERAAASPAEGPDPIHVRTPAVPSAPQPRVEPNDHEERLEDLERRLAALEQSLSARREAPDASDEELPSEEELRDLVLSWVAEDQAAQALTANQQAQQQKQRQLEFDARYQAHMFAREHGLEKWQEDEFAKLFLQVGVRAAQINANIDPAEDPAAVEARWEAFDEWVDQLERELTARVDPALYEKLYGKG